MTANGRTASIDPAAAGLTLLPEATVERLTGFGLEPARLWRHLVGGGAAEPVTDVDGAALADALDGVAGTLGTEPVDASVVFADGAAHTTDAVDGSLVDAEAAADVLRAGWLTAERPIALPTRTVAPDITQEEAERALTTLAEPFAGAPVVVAVGGQSVELPVDVLTSVASVVARDSDLALTVDGARLVEEVLARTTNLLTPSADARFEFGPDGVPVIVPGVAGTTLDPVALADAVVAAGTGTGPHGPRRARRERPGAVDPGARGARHQGDRLGVLHAADQRAAAHREPAGRRLEDQRHAGAPRRDVQPHRGARPDHARGGLPRGDGHRQRRARARHRRRPVADLHHDVQRRLLRRVRGRRAPAALGVVRAVPRGSRVDALHRRHRHEVQEHDAVRRARSRPGSPTAGCTCGSGARSTGRSRPPRARAPGSCGRRPCSPRRRPARRSAPATRASRSRSPAGCCSDGEEKETTSDTWRYKPQNAVVCEPAAPPRPDPSGTRARPATVRPADPADPAAGQPAGPSGPGSVPAVVPGCRRAAAAGRACPARCRRRRPGPARAGSRRRRPPGPTSSRSPSTSA